MAEPGGLTLGLAVHLVVTNRQSLRRTMPARDGQTDRQPIAASLSAQRTPIYFLLTSDKNFRRYAKLGIVAKTRLPWRSEWKCRSIMSVENGENNTDENVAECRARLAAVNLFISAMQILLKLWGKK